MKIDSRINAESKFRANKFLRVHLHILKALYEQEPSTRSTPGDCRVEKKFWDAIEDFLSERNTIERATKRAQRMREIHNEAMEFQKTIHPFSIVNNHIISHHLSPKLKRHSDRNSDPKGPRSNFKLGSSSLMLITQPSPHYLPKRQPRGWNGRGCQSGGQRNQNGNIDVFHEIQSDAMDEDGGNVFGIVSGLLKRKHSLSSRHLNRRTSTLQTLVKESRKRLNALHSDFVVEKEKEKLIFINFEKHIKNSIMAREECEDRQVRIETKIRLWKLLLHDLLGTITI